MEYTYDYAIQGVEVFPEYKGHQNVVRKIHYVITGRLPETGYANGMQVYTTLDYDSITDFIPIESLTSSTLVAWLETTHKDEIDAYKKVIKYELDTQVYATPVFLPLQNTENMPIFKQ